MGELKDTYKIITKSADYSYVDATDADLLHYMKLLSELPEILLMNHSYYVVDYPKRKYLSLKGNVEYTTGWHINEFIYGGLERFVDLFHPEDFRIYNEYIFPRYFEILRSVKLDELKRYTFSVNFRLKGADGEYMQVIQCTRYIINPVTRYPIYSYGTVNNFHSFIKGGCVTATIERRLDDGKHTECVYTETFYPDLHRIKLTRREREILQYITEGYSVRDLAIKLNLSENTVSNHRIRILQKTQSKNVAQLTKFALEKGLL